MNNDKSEQKQKTRPYGKGDQGEPAKPETIPVPKRGAFFRDLEKVATKPAEPESEQR